MTLKLSRRGLNGEWRLDLPFNKTLTFRLQFGLEEGELDPKQAFETAGNTHLWMVYHAAALLKGQGQAGEQILRLIKPWSETANETFHDGLCRGLWDADNHSPYNDPVVDLLPTWASHFYDPDSRTNWLGQSAPTALSEGLRFYDVSLEALVRGDQGQAGYALGLSLHYFTDLTQPMHAANFTWMDSQEFGYHTDFERYVKQVLHRIRPPARYTPLLGELVRSDLFHAAARYSKDAYLASLCPPEWTQSYSKAMNEEGVWEARVGSVVPRILGDAVQMTAQFLLGWARDTSPVRSGLLRARA